MRFFTILLLLLSSYSFGQINAVVIDGDTKQKIPYVNISVLGEDIGTTSDFRGHFIFEKDIASKWLVFSAIGYKTKKLKVSEVNREVSLYQEVTALDEVLILPKKNTKAYVIGSFRKKKINHYFSNGPNPWMIAKYFAYKSAYNETPFLHKLRLLTKSNKPDATFNIRLYSVGENGNPENYIFDENIFGKAKRGKKYTEIDLSNLKIQIPENGFFVVVEWLAIEKNKHDYTYTMEGKKKKYSTHNFQPMIGSVPDSANGSCWIFSKGEWRRNKIPYDWPPKTKEYITRTLAIEMTLTN